MLDIKLIRENPEIVENDLKKRGDEEKLKVLRELIENDKKYRELLQEVEKLKHDRNTFSEEVARLKKEGKDASKKLRKLRKYQGKSSQ